MRPPKILSWPLIVHKSSVHSTAWLVKVEWEVQSVNYDECLKTHKLLKKKKVCCFSLVVQCKETGNVTFTWTGFILVFFNARHSVLHTCIHECDAALCIPQYFYVQQFTHGWQRQRDQFGLLYLAPSQTCKTGGATDQTAKIHFLLRHSHLKRVEREMSNMKQNSPNLFQINLAYLEVLL